MSQPAVFQIANYNVHPTPIVNFDAPLPAANVLIAYLVDSSSHRRLLNGFQGGKRKVQISQFKLLHWKLTNCQLLGFEKSLEAGTKVIYFTGLKLSKMGKIKNECEYAQIGGTDSFYIQFQIGTKTVNSDVFRLVSSTTQLPKVNYHFFI